MSNTINSTAPNIRDFLLNRNLISDTVTNNGLISLLQGIGQPITDIGTYPEAVQPSEDIVTSGNAYKNSNLSVNQFQGTDNDYALININYQPNNPPTSAFIYSSGYASNDGVLYDTLNTPASGPFQGGDIRQFNTSKNLYFDPDKQTVVNLDSFSSPNVQYTNYQDINSGVINNSIDVLGSILNGGGVGIGGDGKLVPNFDLRSTLLGRVLGGTGIISDTPLGQASAKYLAFSLANKAVFGIQQQTIGQLNLNPLNLVMNGFDSIISPNYSITVPRGKLGKVLDFGAKMLGFESPLSLYTQESSIFASENPVSNIDRALAQISNTGKGQVLAMFANINMNRYKPGFSDSRIKAKSGGNDNPMADNDPSANSSKDGVNHNIYAFGTSDGKVIDFLNNDSGSEVNISPSSHNLSGLIEGSGFGDSTDGVGNDNRPFSWSDDFANRDSFERSRYKEKKTLLYKTQELFKTNKISTIISGHGGDGIMGKSQTQSSIQRGFISKGSGALEQAALENSFLHPDDVFCRTWTTYDRYDQVLSLQKSSGINGQTAFREGLIAEDSVLGDNGFVKVGPYIGDVASGNIKNFMFSIENLAWADSHSQAKLIECEKGPGDLMTGLKGRIMWFPPYDLTVSENTAVNWESTQFIGRGEPIYTYSNTERTGTLQFKIVVDHPSYLNAIKGESDEYLSSFFAGCTDIDPLMADKLTTTERNEIETSGGEAIPVKEMEPQTPSLPTFSVYLPNDVSIPFLYPAYEDKYSEELGTGVAFTKDSNTVSLSVDKVSIDRNNFGLNGDKNPGLELEGGWITPAGFERIRKSIIDDCPACVIRTQGFASYQGNKLNRKGNLKIQSDRADKLRAWIEEKILTPYDKNIKDGVINMSDRFEKMNKEQKAGGVVGCEIYKKGDHDTECLKKARKSVATFTFNEDLYYKINPKKPIEYTPIVNKTVSRKIKNRFYNECNYFEKLQQEDKTSYDTLKEKLRFFHPAFHAITPEGLNSRLTFLQQCTRQGPTNIDNAPDNLAFGRPPVCILRLGDFYHTKIVIDNVGVSYEPLVWDLNPEGVGVQPMIATVDLSFKMIGGQSMKGPINKLQNAVSFNFFGNTQVYDSRADKIDVSKEGKAKFTAGIKDVEKTIKADNVDKLEGINGTVPVSEPQIQTAENEAKPEQEVVVSDSETLKEILKSADIYNEPNGMITVRLNDTLIDSLSKEYFFKLTTIVGGFDVGSLDVFKAYLIPYESFSFYSDTNDWPTKYFNAIPFYQEPKRQVSFKIEVEIPSEANIKKTYMKDISMEVGPTAGFIIGTN